MQWPNFSETPEMFESNLEYARWMVVDNINSTIYAILAYVPLVMLNFFI